jgi:hypothetical protein
MRFVAYSKATMSYRYRLRKQRVLFPYPESSDEAATPCSSSHFDADTDPFVV